LTPEEIRIRIVAAVAAELSDGLLEGATVDRILRLLRGD